MTRIAPGLCQSNSSYDYHVALLLVLMWYYKFSKFRKSTERGDFCSPDRWQLHSRQRCTHTMTLSHYTRESLLITNRYMYIFFIRSVSDPQSYFEGQAMMVCRSPRSYSQYRYCEIQNASMSVNKTLERTGISAMERKNQRKGYTRIQLSCTTIDIEHYQKDKKKYHCST